MTKNTTNKRSALARVLRGSVAGAACLISMSAVAMEQEALVTFDISASDLSSVLSEFGLQSGQDIYFSESDTRGKIAVGLKGEYKPSEALEMILNQSGLEHQSNDDNTILIGSLVTQDTTEESARTDGSFQLAQLDPQTTAEQPETDASTTDTDAEDSTLIWDRVFVTGTRGRPRSVADSPIPIDVFSAEQLEQQSQTGLFEALRFVVPSLNLPQRAGGGTATFIASAGLRGLNPDQTLVLVNGKRRHKTALINTSTGLFSGAAGVDLNMIPSSAIERVEVLRDGAAAQYGSDAIAGVVNIILKEDASGGRISGSYGENFDRSDGEYSILSLNTGFALGEDGFANISLEARDKEFSNRALPIPLPEDGGLAIYPRLPDGSLDPREFTTDRLVTSNFGNFPQTTFSVGLNAGYDFGDFELYNFTTIADRESTLDFTFRAPGSSRNVLAIYPDGFRPREVINETDFEAVTGIKGETSGFEWDFSIGYGSNETEWTNSRGVNASLGADSPTSFFLGELNADEFTTQVDVTKGFEVGDGNLQVSFGMQYREEGFEIKRGEPLSYTDGNNGAPPFAQGFPGFPPEAENDVSRENVNGYVELGWEPNEKLFVGGAVRHESFSDSAGEQTVGKINARYEFNDAIAIRASANTGFRAPSIQQLGFRGSRGQFADLDNDGIAESIVLRQTLPSTDPAAQALGAEPLTPELSENISVGLTFTPGYGLSVTVDAYEILVEDRIALSTQFNRGDGRAALDGGTIGTQISALLDAAGFDRSLGGVNYFTNAIDTKSSGVDVVATWQTELNLGSLTLSGAYNYNDDSVEKIDPNPEELAGLVLANGSPIEQFNRGRLATYTVAIPESKVSLNANLDRGNTRFNIRGTRFDEVVSRGRTENNDTVNDAEWIFDLELGYEFENGVEIFAGANNIFNTYPDEVRPPNRLGTGFYNTISPFGFTGGNWYLRAAYNW